MSASEVTLDLGLILAVGLVVVPLARILRVPFMLLLVAVGALLGPSVLDIVRIPLDSTGVEILLTLGVSMILFHGGLHLSLSVLSRVKFGLGMLVVPGVIATTAICGLAAAWFFNVPVTMGLLIGAAIAPTDPAILIPLFERMGLQPKLRQTIVAESALNDPTGAVVALTLLGVVAGGESLDAEPILAFVREIGISLVIGVGAGVLLALVVSKSRWGLWRESAGIAVFAVVALTFFTVQQAGAESGYLGPFVAGLIVGNMDRLKLGMHSEHEREMRTLVQGLSDIMVIFVFVILGADLPWRVLGDYWMPALGVVLVLIFIARPIVIAMCLLPDRRGQWVRPELLFMMWTRETGVVPAALAGLVVSRGIEHADLVMVTVAMAIIVTLALQASTKGWLARRLGLTAGGEAVDGTA